MLSMVSYQTSSSLLVIEKGTSCEGHKHIINADTAEKVLHRQTKTM